MSPFLSRLLSYPPVLMVFGEMCSLIIPSVNASLDLKQTLFGLVFLGVMETNASPSVVGSSGATKVAKESVSAFGEIFFIITLLC